MGGLGLQPASPNREVVIIIDGDAPAADPGAAAQLREALLAGIAGDRRPLYFELNSTTINPVRDAEAESFRRSVFTVAEPQYGGVSVSFTEAVETLRGNQSVRDAVVDRECPYPSVPGCGDRVAAAVDAAVKQTEAASARKLRSVVATAAARRGARVVVVTSGWPARDDLRVALNRAVRDLRELGTSLVIVRMPGRMAFQGLVRDASESLAAHLSSAFVIINDQGDIEHARAVFAEGRPPTVAISTDSAAVAPPVTTATEVPALAPRARDADVPVPALTDRPDDTLRAAAAYVRRFETTFAAVLWHERYEQEARIEQVFGSSGARVTKLAATRTLESELMLLWLPSDATWLAVRDVTSIDGKSRPASERRLPALQAGATLSLLALRELARENGRFNLGGIVRTFNEPTLALLFLDDHYRHRFAFTRRSEQRVEGRRLATYEFAERARPTVVQAQARDVPARGTCRIDVATGQVLETSLELSDEVGQLRGRMTVQYGPSARFDVLVPDEMRETYESGRGESITAVATYSNFRRFQTSGRLITPE